MDIYNKNIFNLLVGLPKFCVLVRNAQTPEERREVLKQVYEVIDRVASYVEYTKTTNEVITYFDIKPTTIYHSMNNIYDKLKSIH